jgi:hypothetical protein
MIQFGKTKEKLSSPKMGLLHALVISAVVLAFCVVVVWSLIHYAGLQASLLWAAIIGAAAWAIQSNIEQKREHQKLLAERKREHYLQFLEFMAKFISKAGDAESAASMASASPDTSIVPLDELRMWSLRLTLIGSDEVVRAWNSARLGSINDQGDGLHMMRSWGRLWLAMRKDCGHLDTKLSVSEVLASFVNDIEQQKSFLDE